ncbi:zinc finger (C3HC4-type RING finger) family protein [Actinidia rufa]|uniref:Zinc finger (C3HC4-type RING finger) family protein n=1 Tax=Actinidia rufa TaxID=165716 RepID=A0A7J0G055_9ERIC|nr:zinc finger (C3HC4-type RING finger) family protein [Actinidia rufa]
MTSEASSSGLSFEGLEDVEEFIGGIEGESSMSLDRLLHVSELVQMGNQAFRDNRFEEAINCYSRANTIKPLDPVILNNRCATYLRLPPAASEHRPLSGLDPTTHAELALKDAEKVLFFQSDSVKSYILKANALILLEKYELARDVILSGLQVDPMSVTLNNIIEKNFPQEYAERKLEHDSLTNYGADLIPLFVMDVIVPCQKFHLNIFEPRYRLMVITDSTTGSIADFACEVEITECEPLPDGRFFLELESRRRFRILRNWNQDGYRVAEIEWVQDIYPSEGTRENADLQELTNNAAGFARSWMRRARDAAQQRRDRLRLLELDKAESMMPTTRDPERFTCYSNKSEAIRTIATPSHERYN